MQQESACFTLELIAENVSGSVGVMLRGSAAGLLSQGRSIPALGLRLLDLAPAIIEAPLGQVYGSAEGSQVSFAGRGKALVFELPEDGIRDGASTQSLPLWIMALVKHPDGAAPGAAVLLSTACVDLRADVLHAAAASADVPCPFRRCAFTMTSVRDAACALTLDCYLRLYAGGHRPLAGGELLLEPSFAMPSQKSALPELPSPAKSTTPAIALDSTFASGPLAFPFGGSLKEPLASPSGPVELPAASPAEERQHRAGGANFRLQPLFAEEICVEGTATVTDQPRPDVGSACAVRSYSTVTGQDTAAGVNVPCDVVHDFEGAHGATTAGEKGSPHVSSSLPLVSELLRELWQIRSVT